MPTPSPARGALTALLSLALAACSAPSATRAPTASPVAAGATSPAIAAADLRLRVEILAHDSLRGREAGTPGAAAAARYLAGEAQRMGLRPAGDQGTYFNRSPVQRRTVAAEVVVTGRAGLAALPRTQALPVSGIAGLPGTTRTGGEGPLVFGGHVVDPEVGSRELSLEQLRGAAVIVRLRPPAGVNAAQTNPRLPIATLFSPSSPASAVLLVAEEGDEELWSYAAGIAARGALELPGARERGAGPAFFLISSALAEQLIGAPLAAARQPRTGLGTLRYTLREEALPVETSNVVAVLPGSDPRRAGEYVALGSHYDHVGVGEPVNGDSIYNGADDDASGVAALLEIAERYASLPVAQRPARSLLFVWHTAEEAGLLGSRSFTENPTVPRDSIVAQLNVDMLGRNGADSVYLVGSRRLSSELGDLVEAVNRARPRPFTLDYSYDAPDHPEQVYCRSDHYNYARFGIPVTFFTTGLHPDYHKPSDEPDTLDYDKLARATELVGDVAAAVANRTSRLRVDRPVPPPGTPCS